nr:CoA transferase [Burkholderia stagnalis]
MTRPLDGIRVLELGQLIAGPFAGRMLAEFGADVIKVEPPGTGDPLRKWRMLHDGTSVWWAAQSRNKTSLTLDLRTPEGQDVIRRLAADADVLIENFRPGTLEGWGLGWDALSAINPGLVMLRMSGFGQSGPYRDRPGFGVIAEAMGGLRHLTGEPGRTPVRVGISLDGYDTGIDLAAALDAAARLPALVGHDVPSQILKAGRRSDLHPAPAFATDGWISRSCSISCRRAERGIPAASSSRKRVSHCGIHIDFPQPFFFAA